MEPNWGLVEILLIGGMEMMSSDISEPTQKMISSDLSQFNYGEVYDLLAYIAKKNRVANLALEEAGRLMGFLPADASSDPAVEPMRGRPVKVPYKSQFPPDWTLQRIIEQTGEVARDPNIPEKILWNDFVRKDDMRGDVAIRVIYSRSPGRQDIWGAYPANAPMTVQRNRVGAYRAHLEYLLTACLEQIKEHLPPIDYETDKDLIDHGVYDNAYRQLDYAVERCGVASEELREAGRILGALPPEP